MSSRAADRRARTNRSRHRPPTSGRRPGLYLGAAVAGAVLVGVVVGTDPAAQADAAAEPVSVAQELGLSAQPGPVDVTERLQPLEELAVSRSTREAAEVAAQQAQAAADKAELDRRAAEAAAAEAAARAAAEAAAAEAAARAAAEAAQAQSATRRAPAAAAAVAPSGGGASVVAKIRNSAGNVKPVVQAAANLVMSNVPGISSIGGTRASAADPGGHPSGLAVDYMTSSAVGDAVVAYHIAHWDELGVEYLIWEQRMLSSPNGSWKKMADRGGATANHMDHVHVNHRG
jgi:hypothetical protein